MEPLDVGPLLEQAAAKSAAERGISTMAQRLVGSEILKIAAEIRGLLARGEKVLNLTVGDFNPKEFPIPPELEQGIVQALREGHSNYPPSDGMPECREAVQALYAARLGLKYPIDSVLIASGSRPMIAGTYLALVDPGDVVVYGLPSWNNNHYCTLVGAERVEIGTRAGDGFFPRADELAPALERARLLCLNTPANPTGTAIEAGALEAICRAVLAENARRQRSGRPALYLMYDQVYWMLTFAGVHHVNPVSLVPEMAPYTLFIDGISKSLSATGVRVGWALGPRDVIKRMSAILTHVGAWAPRAEQIATARLLATPAVLDRHLTRMNGELYARLELLSQAVRTLRAEGHPVEAIAPQGAIYLSLRVDVRGRRGPDGKRLETDEDVRTFLLREAGLAVVPFQAFGVREDTGWFRASVGAVSKADCETISDRLRKALARLS